MSKDSIRLHRKHGLNPTMCVCFWCSKPRGDIALLGASYKKEAPRHMIVDLQPCDDCKAKMAQGITLVEVKTSSDRPQIVPGATPTGAWIVITEDALQRIMCDGEALKRTLKTRKALVPVEVFREILTASQASTPDDAPAS